VAGHPAICRSGRLLLQCQHAGDLAAAIKNPYQTAPWRRHPAKRRWRATIPLWTLVRMWISGKPGPQVQAPGATFYAAGPRHWWHDTRAGLRIKRQVARCGHACQVIPLCTAAANQPEASTSNGLGRCTAQGYIAGTYAAVERPEA